MSNQGESSGCLKWFIVLMGVILVSVLLIVFGGYYVIFHTAWPIKKVVNLVTADTDIEIDGIEGSISSGFSVETIRIPDEDGDVTEIDDIAFKYETGGDAFIINDIHIARAHIFVDDLFSDDETTGDYSGNNNQYNSSNSEQMNLIVKKVDIADVTLEDKKTGAKINIDKIYLDGFEVINDNVKLGTLTVKSDHCDIEVKPVDSSLEMATEHVIKGIIKKGIHESVIKDITLSGNCIAESTESYTIDLKMFDGKCFMKIQEPGKAMSLNITNFSPI
jgi:hypothetical protein